MMDYLAAVIHDEDLKAVFEFLAGAVGTLAMAVALVSKMHLKTLNKTIDAQAVELASSDEKQTKIKAAHQRLQERTENLERAFSINAECPMESCPNKQLLKAAEVITNARAEASL